MLFRSVTGAVDLGDNLVQVTGVVEPRPEGSANPNLASGEVEVNVTDLKVLNKAAALPFQIEDASSAEVGEETRLRYRYLDLRRERQAQAIRLRAKANQAARRVLDSHDFTEIETPTLTRSTPEGARDFLVPARLKPGSWYALPQSPQLFKQLLMVAGMERYYQIARCYRDEALRADGFSGATYLFKNNVDSRGNSYGAHENYLVSRELALKSFGEQLLPFLVTRQLICGAGKIAGGRYVISQRADQVWEGVSSATTRTRPIINTRDEPHADSHRFRRMHVIVGDSNMSEPTFALKVGSMLLVIEMLEAGFDLPDMELADPIAHIRDIAGDPTGSTELTLAAGGTITALEVQRNTLEAAKRWLLQRPDEGTPNAEMSRVVDLWDRVLEAIADQDFSAVDTEIDWVIKRKLLTQFKDRLGCDWDHPKLAQIDLTYHDINPERGLF